MSDEETTNSDGTDPLDPVKEWPTEVPRKTPEQIKELARQAVRREIFITNTKEGIENAFAVPMSLAGATNPPAPDSYLASIGAVYEESSKAASRGINGFPMFMSCQFLHKDDVEALKAEYERMEAALA